MNEKQTTEENIKRADESKSVLSIPQSTGDNRLCPIIKCSRGSVLLGLSRHVILDPEQFTIFGAITHDNISVLQRLLEDDDNSRLVVVMCQIEN